jgi:hypothetical protein
MAALALRKLGAWITAAIPSGLLVVACGTDTSTIGAPGADGAPPSQGCASGEVYCTGCGGGGFCAQACPAVQCPSTDGGPEDAAAAGDAGGAEGGACPATAPTYCLDCSGGGFCVSGTCPATTCPIRDAGADAPASVDGSEGGSSDGAPAGLIRCGSSWCNAMSENCRFHADWSVYCGPKATGGGLSCSSPASCPAGQICCAWQDIAGTVTAQCSAAPCPAGPAPSSPYLLCATQSDCPSGQPCSYNIIPASPGGPVACDKCAGVSCASPKQCCPGSGTCYNPGCGSCCT